MAPGDPVQSYKLVLIGVVSVAASMGVFDWSSSVTYVLIDWMFLTILYSTGTGNEAM